MSKIQTEIQTTVQFNTKEEFIAAAELAYDGNLQYVFSLACETGKDDYQAVILCREVFDTLMSFASIGGMLADDVND